MEPLFFVMAIMGCGDGQQACRQVRTETAQYHTLTQCQSDMTAALARNSDVSYPVITAACQAQGGLVAKNAVGKDRRG